MIKVGRLLLILMSVLLLINCTKDEKSVLIKDMPTPQLDLVEYMNLKTYFSVNTYLKDFSGNLNGSPVNKIEFSLDNDFANILILESVDKLKNTYYKEAGDTIYVKSTYSYNGVSKSIIKSISTPEAFIAGNNWKGEGAIAYDSNGKMIFEMGAVDGKRLFFEIANFKGVGEYPLEGDPDNTYIFSGNPLRKYTLKKLSADPLVLCIYKDVDGVFYGRIGKSTVTNTYMSFKAEDGSIDFINGIIFKAEKKSSSISKEMSDILGKYKGNFNVYKEITIDVKYLNKDTIIIHQPININTDKTFPIYVNVRFNGYKGETSLYIPRQYIKELDSYIIGNKIPFTGILFKDPRDGKIDKNGRLTYTIIKDNVEDPNVSEYGNSFIGGIKIK